MTKLCTHTSHHSWFHGSHEKMPTYFFVTITPFPCMVRSEVEHFLLWRTSNYHGCWEMICQQGCLQSMVAMITCMVRRTYGLNYGATYAYQGTIYGAIHLINSLFSWVSNNCSERPQKQSSERKIADFSWNFFFWKNRMKRGNSTKNVHRDIYDCVYGRHFYIW